MHRTIIADTSCFIILTKIEELEILQKVYGEIITTTEIVNEFGEKLPSWIKVKEVIDKQKQQLLEFQIDKGESSAIALALETESSTVVLDDIKARKIAKHLGLNYTGTLGILIKAKLLGIIPSISPIIAKIKQTNFRLSPELELQVLKEANEE